MLLFGIQWRDPNCVLCQDLTTNRVGSHPQEIEGSLCSACPAAPSGKPQPLCLWVCVALSSFQLFPGVQLDSVKLLSQLSIAQPPAFQLGIGPGCTGWKGTAHQPASSCLWQNSRYANNFVSDLGKAGMMWISCSPQPCRRKQVALCAPQL